MSVATIFTGTQGAGGSSQEGKENQRECTYWKLGKEKNQSKTKPFSGVGTARAVPLLSCLVWTDVSDVPREDLEAVQDFKLSKKSSKFLL